MRTTRVAGVDRRDGAAGRRDTADIGSAPGAEPASRAEIPATLAPPGHSLAAMTIHPPADVDVVTRAVGRPLDTPVRAEMEARFGVSFADVRVHDDEAAQRSAARLGARAYTCGSHLVAGRDGMSREVLAHELVHVLQQRQGPVAGSGDGRGLSISDPHDSFERAAVQGARRALSGLAPLIGTAPPPRGAPGPAPATGRPLSVQRQLTTRDGLVNADTEDSVRALADSLTRDKQTRAYRGLVRWYLLFWFRQDQEFSDFPALVADVARMLEEWQEELVAIGIKENELPAAYQMYELLENADPNSDEAALHKLVYPRMKERWVNTRGGGEDTTHAKGTVYNPVVYDPVSRTKKNIHTMPLNFSWLAALAHHNLTVRIIVPVTERVLIRQGDTSSSLTPMDEVRANRVPAPLSATAREILGLLRTGFYRLDEEQSTEYEKVLKPTGRGAIAWPKDVEIPKTMLLKDLATKLGGYGITIQNDQVAIIREMVVVLSEDVIMQTEPPPSSLKFEFPASDFGAKPPSTGRRRTFGRRSDKT